MADQKLSQLDQAATLTGTELAYVVQSGAQKRTTAAALAAVLPEATTTTAGKLSAADKALLSALVAAGLEVTPSGAVVIPHIHGDVAGTIYFHVKNVSGGPLTKGTPISVVGAVGDTTTLEVVATNPSTPGRTRAQGLLYADLANNAEGHAVILGELVGVNTATFVPESPLWVGATGGITGTRPASAAQEVATVGRQHASTGTLLVAIQGVEPTAAQIGAATAAQGALADSAVQPGDLASVATSGAYGDLTGRPTLGTAATLDHGTSPGNAVRLDPTTGRLPAVDGSQLTNLPSGATPGGTATEIQYRNAGALGAIPSSAVDGTTGAVTLARLLLSANGAASASPLNLNGAWFTGGTGTNNYPQLLVSPTGATLPTLNTAGMGAIINAPAGFTGELLWVGVNGTGQLTLSQNILLIGNGAANTGAVDIGARSRIKETGAALILCNSSVRGDAVSISANGELIVIGTNKYIGLRNGAVRLNDDADNILALRSGTSAQTFRVYDTFTSDTSYHRIAISTARATLTNVSGASVTATGLIPAGAVILGVTSKVTTALGTGNGTTGYKIGTAADDDRWGNITGTAAGTTSDNRDWTSGTVECFPAATNVIVTANGGNFNGTGVIYLSVQFMAGQAD